MNHSSKPAKRPKPLTALQICQKELAEVRRQRAAISEVLRAIANSPHDLQPSPYSTPSSTAQCSSTEQRGAPSVLSRKQAFVSLSIKQAPPCQSCGHRQCFGNTAAL